MEGKRTIHFLQKHGLASKQVIDDLAALQKASSPAEMEKEALRMKNDRAMRAEIAQLKQGRVPPQTFDNSQGSAEATTNQDRLYDAYLAGDRSEAAVRAVRKLTLGN
jgi:DNA-binding transcriptional MerR regulator